MVEPRLSFGLDAQAYHRHRFAYPARLWEILRGRCALGPGARVFEVGAGTGIATGPLLASGAEVTAIEPDPRMAALLRQRLAEVTLQEAAFEEIALPPQSFDLGCAATSFHWVGPAGLNRVRAALRPGGWWAMWWNIHRAPGGEDAFSRAVQPHYDRLGVAEPSENSLPSQMTWDGPLSAAGFHRITTERLPWEVTQRAEEIRALYATYSPIRVLDAARRTALLDAIAETVERQFGGQVTRTYHTLVVTGQLPSAGLSG